MCASGGLSIVTRSLHSATVEVSNRSTNKLLRQQASPTPIGGVSGSLLLIFADPFESSTESSRIFFFLDSVSILKLRLPYGVTRLAAFPTYNSFMILENRCLVMVSSQAVYSTVLTAKGAPAFARS